MQTLLDAESSNARSSSGQAGNDYMIRTATVHDLIDRARSTDGLSPDNLAAVSKLWRRDKESLDDGVNELSDMIQRAPSSLGPDQIADTDDDDDGDGWDELGLETKALTAPEVEQAKKTHVILRLSVLLHERLANDLLSTKYLVRYNTSKINPHLDSLPRCSSKLLAASDDLIASMYGPQHPENIARQAASFKEAIRQLQSSITPLVNEQSLEEQLKDMNQKQDSLKSRKKAESWFNACFGQILKSLDALSTTQ
ncbi:hypothetical protein AX17_003539 [Amanita inopinata Kibby_2008]|nr:hypothetical protein AX17_003539 [Amanita inopinata Kibby_2008]